MKEVIVASLSLKLRKYTTNFKNIGNIGNFFKTLIINIKNVYRYRYNPSIPYIV